MKCETINNKKIHICTNAFDKKIKVQISTTIYNNSPDSEPTYGFTTIAEVWALIKTTNGNEFFDGVSVLQNNNTDFYIRFNTAIDITKQLFVDYQNVKYRINTVENINKQNKVLKLRSQEKGDNTKLANYR